MKKVMSGMCMRTALVAMVSILMVPSAYALSIFDLDTGGQVTTGQWVVEGEAAVGVNAPGDWWIRVGTGNWGAASGDTQTVGWHAAGLVLPENTTGYRVEFDYDLYTWDAYVGGSEGTNWYDNMGVNLNGVGLLWNQALSDPDTPHGGSWPGVMWSWGGLTDNALDHTQGSSAVEGVGTFLTVFLSTGLDPDADDQVPSWGGFNTTAPPPVIVPEPAGLGLLGLALLAARKKRK